MRSGALVVIVAAARAASAQPVEHEFSAEARGHYEAGQRRFEAKDYAAAIAEFRAGYAIDHDPYWFYVEAQVERVEALAGDTDKCRDAIENYRKFLAQNPPADDARTATYNAGRCQLDIAKQPPKVVVRVVKPPAMERDPWYADKWGVALGGAGVAAAAVGAGALWFAHQRAHDADVAPTLGGYEHEAKAADRDRLVGILAGAAGGALIIGAAIHIAIRPEHAVVVTPTATSRSAGLSLVGSF
jgi:tetratricopeptide (TPR) repeat protein